MIKKINQLFEDMPLIIKIIIGIILVGILTCMTMFIKIAKVSAATIDYTATDIYVLEKNIISQTESYQRYNNNTSTGSYLTSVVKQINIQFNNFQSGSATSIITLDLNGFNTNNLNCSNAIARVEWKQGLTHNNIPSTVNRNGWSCNNGRIQVQYNSQMVVTSGDYIELQIELSNWTTISNEIIANGTMSVNSSQNASNEDITNQTTQIITNAIQNALDIITNENNNTNAITQMIQDLTNNITGKVQDAIENTNNHCEIINSSNVGIDNKALQLNGSLLDHNYYIITEYIPVNEASIITVKEMNSALSQSTVSRCFYNKDKSLKYCQAEYNDRNNSQITIPEGTKYIRFSIRKNNIENPNQPQYKICQPKEIWQNEQDENRHTQLMDKIREIDEMYEDESEEQKGLLNGIISSITGLFNFFNDDDIEDPDLSSLGDNVGSNGVITDLLLLPVSLWQKVILSINGTCQTFVIGELWGTNLTMPCIHLENILGSTLWNVFDVILSGFLLWNIRKHFIKIFNNLTSLKTGGNELE